VPGVPSELLNVHSSLDAFSNAATTTAVHTTTTSGAEVILAGPPKVGASYSSFADIDVSHLSLIIHANDQPPGFDPTWYLNGIGKPLINNRGAVAFWGDARDALAPSSSFTPAIWLGDTPANLKLVAAAGIPIDIDGVQQTLAVVSDVTNSNLSARGETTNSGRPSQLSDNGQLVFMGSRDSHPLGTFPSAIFITESCPRATIDSDFNGDCKADLLIRNMANGRLFMWEMDGNLKTWYDVGPLALNREVAGTGDLTGDGKADIVLRRTDSGYVYMWEMDGNLKTWHGIGALDLTKVIQPPSQP
jgi:hypothetical protein